MGATVGAVAIAEFADVVGFELFERGHQPLGREAGGDGIAHADLVSLEFLLLIELDGKLLLALEVPDLFCAPS